MRALLYVPLCSFAFYCKKIAPFCLVIILIHLFMKVCTSGNGSIVLLCRVTSNYYIKLLRYGPMSWYRLHYVITLQG